MSVDARHLVCYHCRMLKIRLQRVGRKNDPSFRIVVTESTHGPKSGRIIEAVGSHNPRSKGETRVAGERVLHWMSKGAQVSVTLHNLLVDQNIISAKKLNALPSGRPAEKGKTEGTGVSEAAPTPAPAS